MLVLSEASSGLRLLGGFNDTHSLSTRTGCPDAFEYVCSAFLVELRNAELTTDSEGDVSRSGLHRQDLEISGSWCDVSVVSFVSKSQASFLSLSL